MGASKLGSLGGTFNTFLVKKAGVWVRLSNWNRALDYRIVL